MAHKAVSEFKTKGRPEAAVSKTVMGHWPIESSNLSLSATSSWRSVASAQPRLPTMHGMAPLRQGLELG